ESTVKMMARQGNMGYAKVTNAALVSLTYEDDGVSMVLILLDERDGLAALESALTAEQLDEWIGRLSVRDVILSMPRFKVESKFSLGDVLHAMGMTDAFAGVADFSKMSTEGLLISAVIHKAFVE